jgi:SAM-dependent methyltransferase
MRVPVDARSKGPTRHSSGRAAAGAPLNSNVRPLMPAATSPVERFLTDFHNTRPGLTGKAFGALPVVFGGSEFGSSYEVLTAAVPTIAAPIQLLDLACGDGFLLSLLAARSQPDLVLNGVDMSSAELDVARARLQPTVVLRQARVQELPFAPRSFDYVLSHLALNLMDDVEKVLREVHRVLKPGAAFVVIIGAAPPPSLAFTTYVDVLSRHPRQAHFSDVRFGDRRLRHPDGVHELLSHAFRNVFVEDIHISRRLTPDELWRWFLDMYDLYFLGEASRHSAEREYLAAVATHCGSDGRLEYLETLRYVGAVA